MEYALAAEMLDATYDYKGNGDMFVCASTRLLPAGNARLNPPSNPKSPITVQAGNFSPVQINAGDHVSQNLVANYDESSVEGQLIDALSELLAGKSLEGESREAAEAALEVISTEEQHGVKGRSVLRHARDSLSLVSDAGGVVSLIAMVLQAVS